MGPNPLNYTLKICPFYRMLIVSPFKKIWEIVLNGSPKMRKQHPELTGLPCPPRSGSSLVTGGEGEGDAGVVAEPRGLDDPPGGKAFVCTFPSAQGDDLQAKSSGQSERLAQVLFIPGPLPLLPSPFSLTVKAPQALPPPSAATCYLPPLSPPGFQPLQPPACRSIILQQTKGAGKALFLQN